MSTRICDEVWHIPTLAAAFAGVFSTFSIILQIKKLSYMKYEIQILLKLEKFQCKANSSNMRCRRRTNHFFPWAPITIARSALHNVKRNNNNNSNNNKTNKPTNQTKCLKIQLRCRRVIHFIQISGMQYMMEKCTCFSTVGRTVPYLFSQQTQISFKETSDKKSSWFTRNYE